MTGKYKAIPLAPIARDTKVDRHTYNYQAGILPDAPAIYVMTDFKDITPFAIDPAASIDAANDKMIACGVRLLFVTSSDGSLLGLVTSTDILGEKPVQYLREHGGPRSDIQVLDIMTPHDQLEALQLTDVVAATVGDIIETMKAVNRKHMLVIETSQAITGESIRGMFSATQISRQTGIEISLAGRASTFAELKRAIAPA